MWGEWRAAGGFAFVSAVPVLLDLLVLPSVLLLSRRRGGGEISAAAAAADSETAVVGLGHRDCTASVRVLREDGGGDLPPPFSAIEGGQRGEREGLGGPGRQRRRRILPPPAAPPPSVRPVFARRGASAAAAQTSIPPTAGDDDKDDYDDYDYEKRRDGAADITDADDNGAAAASAAVTGPALPPPRLLPHPARVPVRRHSRATMGDSSFQSLFTMTTEDSRGNAEQQEEEEEDEEDREDGGESGNFAASQWGGERLLSTPFSVREALGFLSIGSVAPSSTAPDPDLPPRGTGGGTGIGTGILDPPSMPPGEEERERAEKGGTSAAEDGDDDYNDGPRATTTATSPLPTAPPLSPASVSVVSRLSLPEGMEDDEEDEDDERWRVVAADSYGDAVVKAQSWRPPSSSSSSRRMLCHRRRLLFDDSHWGEGEEEDEDNYERKNETDRIVNSPFGSRFSDLRRDGDDDDGRPISDVLLQYWDCVGGAAKSASDALLSEGRGELVPCRRGGRGRRGRIGIGERRERDGTRGGGEDLWPRGRIDNGDDINDDDDVYDDCDDDGNGTEVTPHSPPRIATRGRMDFEFAPGVMTPRTSRRRHEARRRKRDARSRRDLQEALKKAASAEEAGAAGGGRKNDNELRRSGRRRGQEED